MYLMYVDESGDSGMQNSPTRYFVLTGVVVHELRWNEYLSRIIGFRKKMRSSFGLLLREEIHAAKMLNKPGSLVRIKRNDRLSIIKFFIDELATMPDLSIINVVVDKHGKPQDYDVLENAWKTLVQRFSNTMSHRNFPGPANPDERGLVIPDLSEVKKITEIIRKMRRFNPIPNQAGYETGYRNLLITNLVEDPYFKDSEKSYFIQMADITAFALYQNICPSTYMKKKSGHNFFKRLQGVLCTVASSRDPYGIVWL
jgi:hypothetical protein